jgi:thiol-disulfide isomerase/thioredoxin
MSKPIYFLIFLLLALSCKKQPETFEYKISGTIKGQESGTLYLTESNRVGDEDSIPIVNGTFEFKGTSSYLYSSFIFLDRDLQKGIFPIVIEPGEMVLELNADSLQGKSKILSGPYTISMQKAQKEYTSLFPGANFKLKGTKKEVIKWIKKNHDNYMPINFLSDFESSEDFIPLDELGDFLKSIHDKKLKKSREYIQLYSIWVCKKDSINSIGKEATDFKLPNIGGDIISFNSIAKNKLTFVERSGSWCGNETSITRQLKPIYEKYNKNGFEIITIVPESKLVRWQQWIKNENFPWNNFIELEDDIARREIKYSSMLFKGSISPNYLVDENGVVIATNLSPEVLNETLMKRFEPEAYEKYFENKWVLPENTYILDKVQPVNSFKELVKKLSGKPFLIDCWATWCSPCLEEFKYYEQLKTFLKSQNMKIVYLNFDQPIDESKWLNTIRNYKLQGYHFRLNDSFSNDLVDIGYKGSLPAYMIVDSNGEIVEKNAFRPSQKEKLYNQIKNVLKKNGP